jgi:hypothetical protein
MTARYAGPGGCLAAECNNRIDCLGIEWVEKVSVPISFGRQDFTNLTPPCKSRICHVHLASQSQATPLFHQFNHFIYKKELSKEAGFPTGKDDISFKVWPCD